MGLTKPDSLFPGAFSWMSVRVVLLVLMAIGGPLAGCGSGSPSVQSTPVAFSTAGWESLAGDVSLAAVHGDSPRIEDCRLSAAENAPRILRLSNCGKGRGGVIAVGGRARAPTCSKEPSRTRCSVRSGVSVTVEAPRAASAIALLKETIEAIDEAIPDDALVWSTWPEPNLEGSKGSLTLASPRHVSEANVEPCVAGKQAAAMLGRLEVSKRTARHVAGRGVHLLMIEKLAAVRSFSMAIDGECRMGQAGTLRGPTIKVPASRVKRFVLVIPNYYSASHRRNRRALLRGLMLEPKLYRGEKHNQLPETMRGQPEDREATGGEIPLFSAAWAD